jgi:hypothetical protein
MGYYRDPYAAAYVARTVREKFWISKLSIDDFALRLSVNSSSEIESLLTGRRHFPLELVKPVARALDIDEGELGYLTLLIYFPAEAMTVNFEAIGAYSHSLQHTMVMDATGDKAKKKKKRNSRKHN